MDVIVGVADAAVSFRLVVWVEVVQKPPDVVSTTVLGGSGWVVAPELAELDGSVFSSGFNQILFLEPFIWLSQDSARIQPSSVTA